MQLSRRGSITLGVVTAAAVIGPLLFAGLMVALMFFLVFVAAGAEATNNAGPVFLPFGIFFVIMPIQFLLVFLLLGLQVFYFVHLVRNVTAPELTRILLGLGFFFLPQLAMPIYYCMYVWPLAVEAAPSPA